MAQQPRIYSRELVQQVGVVRAPAIDFSGIESLAAGVQRYAAREQAKQDDKDRLTLAAAKNDVRKRATEFGAQYATDPEAYQETFAAYSARTVEALPERLRATAGIEFERLGLGAYNAIANRVAERARSFEASNLQADTNADLEAYLSLSAEGAGVDQEALAARAALESGLQARVEAGHLAPGQAAATIAEADAKAQGLTYLAFNKETYRSKGYLAAMQDLQEGLAADESIPLDIRNALVNQGQEWVREQNALAEKADALAKEHLVDLEDKTAKDGWELHATGGLTQDWVLSNKDALPRTEFKALLAATRGDAGHVDDPEVQSDLERRAYAGEDVTEDALLAYERGDLKGATLRTVLSTSRTIRRQGGPEGDYERAKKFIADKLAPIPGVPNQAAKSTFADARRMLDDYVTSAPEDAPRTSKEIWEFTEQTVARFETIDWSEVSAALPKPRFFVGDRNNPNIEATETELVRALEEGRISREQFDFEAQIVDRWRNAMAARGARRGK